MQINSSVGVVGCKMHVCPPKVDRLDVAGGLNQGLSEPGELKNKAIYQCHERDCPRGIYCFPMHCLMPDRKDRVSLIYVESGPREKRNVIPDTVVLDNGFLLKSHDD
jgi:hypothetical protein